MKFLTPELFVRLNSSNDTQVARAERDWQRAVGRYRNRFARIAPDLPDELRRFCQEVNPHDAEIVGLAKGGVRTPRRRYAELIIRTGNDLVTLTYALLQKPLVQRPVESPVFYDEQPIWLYDEVECLKAGVFSHEVLLSNGYVLKFTFQDFEYDGLQLVYPLRERQLAGI